ncbi:protein kinase domain-containing protein [Streptomyces sp. NBC_01190]|uniref:protein kinase domain-containing protein n=1 Tax=Streptomyces sp. NBC_01190 TaxID=2903767 RepID=UPI00386BA7EA|nr:serine/threonine protein kinase [Streptomyces sp. NBC_01190]
MGVSHLGQFLPAPVLRPLAAGDPPALSGHRIIAVLGDGALGRVYLAYAPDGRPVALTVPSRSAAERPGFTARLHQEVRSAGRVPAGPYTVAVLGSGSEGDRHWFATAYLPAISLRAAVDGAGPLPTRTVLRLVAGVVEGLRVVHHAGVVHGDLRPAQVLLTAEGPALKGYGLTPVGADPAAGGGPVFLAPEQADGKTPLAATDIFALGQLAAYASIGAAPFGPGAADAVLPRVRQEEPDLSELPGELREIVTRCLIKDPALRPSPAQIAAMCRQAAPMSARRFHRHPAPWLPATLAAAVGPAALPPAPPPPTAVPFHPAPPLQPAQPTRPVPPVPLAPPVPAAAPPGARLPHALPWGPPYRPHGLTVRRPRRRTSVLVAAVAGLALAVTAGVVAADGLRVDQPAHGEGAAAAPASSLPAVPTAPAAPAPSPAAPAPSPAAPGGGGATGSAQPSGPVGYPAVRLPAGYALSWRDGPPVARPGPYNGDFGLTPAADAFVVDPRRGTLAPLPPRAPVTPDACRAAAPGAQLVRSASVSAGTRLCLRSADGATAVLTIRQLPSSQGAERYTTLDVLVWRVVGERGERGEGGQNVRE